MTPERIRAAAPTILVVAVTAGAAFTVGAIGGHLGTTPFAILIGVVVVGAIVLLRPALVGVVSLLAIFNVYRVSAGASANPGAMTGISYSDAALAGATLLAVPSMARTPEIRRLGLPLLGLALYFVALLPTFILNHSHRADAEAFHRFILVGGALVVGAWLTRDRLVKPALLTVMVMGFVVGVVTIISGAAHGFTQPASPFGLNKNYGGALQGDLAVIMIVLGRKLGLNRITHLIGAAVFVGATFATHSRGSMLGICAGLFITIIGGGLARSRVSQAIVVVLTAGLGLFMYNSIQAQMNVPTNEFKLNPIGVRQQVEQEARRIWRTSPWDGVGLKYFTSGNYGHFGSQAPNNVVDNELAESGIIGLTGFVALAGCVGVAGWTRRKDAYVLTGLALVVGHLAHGQVDVYWQAGLVPLPYLVLGMGLAAPPSRDPVERAVAGVTA
ncbi:O-antigen ligase family protein [Nocardioides baekrokdamisoli]|nr:O-antigen ligase family protein [Nocardioides baekrokdamisoli]